MTNNHTRSLSSSLGVLFACVTVLLQQLTIITTSDAFSINTVQSVQSAVQSVQVFEHSKCHTPTQPQLHVQNVATRKKTSNFICQQTQPHHQSHLTTLFNSNTSTQNSNGDQEKEDRNVSTPLPSYGGLLGKITGLSMTAIRQSIRTTTGLSLTATRTALRGLTGVSVTGTMKMLFGIFPPWVRVTCDVDVVLNVNTRINMYRNQI